MSEASQADTMRLATTPLSVVAEYIASEMKRPALYVADPSAFVLAVCRLGYKNFMELVRVLRTDPPEIYIAIDPKEKLLDANVCIELPYKHNRGITLDGYPEYTCLEIIMARKATISPPPIHHNPPCAHLLKKPRCRS